jgi:integrase
MRQRGAVDALGAQDIVPSECARSLLSRRLRSCRCYVGVEDRDRLETARRLRSVIGSAFRFAVATGRASNDPTGALRGALIAPTVRPRAAIIDPAALGELLRAIAGRNGMPEVRCGLQLLALSFVRPRELRGAKWSEIDLDRAADAAPQNPRCRRHNRGSSTKSTYCGRSRLQPWTRQLGGKRAYEGRFGEDRSARRSRHSVASEK